VRDRRYLRILPIRGIGDNFDRIKSSSIVIVGIGAIGSNFFEMAVRLGIGRIKIIDRDIVEEENLLTTGIFLEEDSKRRLPKVFSAEKNGRRINKEVEIEPLFENLDSLNIESLIGEVDLIIDGTDNLETRFLLNEYSFLKKIPWVHGACVAERGEVSFFEPFIGPCYRCIFNRLPERGRLDSCEVSGVTPVVAKMVALIQMDLVLKYLTGSNFRRDFMYYFDFGDDISIRKIMLKKREDCPLCGYGRVEFFGKKSDKVVSFCGDRQVMLKIEGVDFDKVRDKWKVLGDVFENEYLLVLKRGDLEITLFRDGKIFIKEKGIDEKRARSIVSRFIGV
jgi:adenylyltransferase/sulfurtransferase